MTQLIEHPVLLVWREAQVCYKSDTANDEEDSKEILASNSCIHVECERCPQLRLRWILWSQNKPVCNESDSCISDQILWFKLVIAKEEV